MIQPEWKKASTEAKIELLKGAWESNTTAKKIGAKLGVSRNAIIGVYERNPALRISHPLQVSTHLIAGRAPRKYKPRQPKVKKPLPIITTPPIEVEEPTPLGVLLEHLNHNMCHWPINEGGPYLFCGQPAESTYCPYHTDLGVRPHVREGSRKNCVDRLTNLRR